MREEQENGARAVRRKTVLDAPDDLAEAPGYGARRLHQAYLAAWSKHVDPVLTGPQFAVLCAVQTYPQADQSTLATAVALDTSTMADVCGRLERRGLLSRRPAPHDARAKVLSLTEAGLAAFTEAAQHTAALNAALLQGCPEPLRASLAPLLNELAQHWEKIAELEQL